MGERKGAAGRGARPPKHQPTAAELVNDPTLRWWPYRRLELVWSDTHRAYLRFDAYVPFGKVRLLTFAGGELPGTHDPLSVRRPNAGRGENVP
jgi:hypothetical protein